MATRRTLTAERIPANIAFATSRDLTPRFLIASIETDDHTIEAIKEGDLAAVAIVYANSAQAAIGRFRKQYGNKANRLLDVVAIEYPSAPSKRILAASLTAYNENLQDGEVSKNVAEIESEAAVSNNNYKAKKIRAAKKRRERIKAKTAVGETNAPAALFTDHAALSAEYFAAASALAEKAGVRVSNKPITRSKKAAIETAKKTLKASSRVSAKKKTTKKKKKKKTTTKKKASKKK